MLSAAGNPFSVAFTSNTTVSRFLSLSLISFTDEKADRRVGLWGCGGVADGEAESFRITLADGCSPLRRNSS